MCPDRMCLGTVRKVSLFNIFKSDISILVNTALENPQLYRQADIFCSQNGDGSIKTIHQGNLVFFMIDHRY